MRRSEIEAYRESASLRIGRGEIVELKPETVVSLCNSALLPAELVDAARPIQAFLIGGLIFNLGFYGPDGLLDFTEPMRKLCIDRLDTLSRLVSECCEHEKSLTED